jgi:hypothetical protein
MMGAGKPLTRAQRKMLLYGPFFVSGMGYSMALGASLDWEGKWSLLLTAAWGALLGLLAWWRHRYTSEGKLE